MEQVGIGGLRDMVEEMDKNVVGKATWDKYGGGMKELFNQVIGMMIMIGLLLMKQYDLSFGLKSAIVFRGIELDEMILALLLGGLLGRINLC